MNLVSLNTYNLAKYGGIKMMCECGFEHEVKTSQIVFGCDKISQLATLMEDVMPRGAAISIVCDKNIQSSTKRCFEKAIGAAGYRVHTHIFDSPPMPSVESCEKIILPEDIRLIVGVGGGTIADIVKYTAQSKNLPSAFILTSPSGLSVLSPSAMLIHNEIEKTFKTSVFRFVLCDTNYINSVPPRLTASAFGELVSKLIALFDWKAAHILNDEKFCPVLFDLAYGIIDTLISGINGNTYKTINASLAESSLKYSALTQMLGTSRMLSGGESCVAHALRILFDYEQRKLFFRGENEFLFSRILTQIYKNLLRKRVDFFVPPPDNNMRLEKLKEFFNLSESNAARIIYPLPPSWLIKLQNYRFMEYSDELYELICIIELKIARAWKIFKRLQPDDGFSLVNYIDESDVSLCVALAPDLKEKFTSLTYMKNCGLLDYYIKDLL